MSASADTFSLLAELAIAIAGFGGVAAAFGGRDRTFKPTERMRLVAIFIHAGTAFFGCLLWTTAFEAGLPATKIQKLVSIGMLGCVVIFMMSRLPATFRNASEPDSTSETWVLVVTVSYTLVLFCVYVANAVWLASSWVLAAAFSLQLLFSLWMFFRLLTRPN
jgi:hypothetical protein